MPTLKEFVNDVLVENNIIADQDQIIKSITQIARGRAVDGCCAISDEEVRNMVINNAELNKMFAKEKEEKNKAKKEKAAQEKLQKKLEEERKKANGEQISLF